MRFDKSVHVFCSHHWFWLDTAFLLIFLLWLLPGRLLHRRYLFTHLLQVVFQLVNLLLHLLHCLFTNQIRLGHLPRTEPHILYVYYQVLKSFQYTGDFLITFGTNVLILVARCDEFSHFLKEFPSRTDLTTFQLLLQLFEVSFKLRRNHGRTQTIKIMTHIFNNLQTLFHGTSNIILSCRNLNSF